jgi:hypothetical protein
LIAERQYRCLFEQLSIKGWRTKEPANLDVPVEKPRVLRQMAELLYGQPIEYERMAADLHLSSPFGKSCRNTPILLESGKIGHARRATSFPSRNPNKRHKSIRKRAEFWKPGRLAERMPSFFTTTIPANRLLISKLDFALACRKAGISGVTWPRCYLTQNPTKSLCQPSDSATFSFLGFARFCLFCASFSDNLVTVGFSALAPRSTIAIIGSREFELQS